MWRDARYPLGPALAHASIQLYTAAVAPGGNTYSILPVVRDTVAAVRGDVGPGDATEGALKRQWRYCNYSCNTPILRRNSWHTCHFNVDLYYSAATILSDPEAIGRAEQVNFDLSSTVGGLSEAVASRAATADESTTASDRHCSQRAGVGVAHQQVLFRSASRVVLTSADSLDDRGLPSHVVSMILALQNETPDQLGVPPKGMGAHPTQPALSCGMEQELQRTSTVRIGQQTEPDRLTSSSPERELQRTSTVRIGQPVQVGCETEPALEQRLSEPEAFNAVVEAEPRLERTRTIRIGQQPLSPHSGVGSLLGTEHEADQEPEPKPKPEPAPAPEPEPELEPADPATELDERYSELMFAARKGAELACAALFCRVEPRQRARRRSITSLLGIRNEDEESPPESALGRTVRVFCDEIVARATHQSKSMQQLAEIRGKPVRTTPAEAATILRDVGSFCEAMSAHIVEVHADELKSAAVLAVECMSLGATVDDSGARDSLADDLLLLECR